MIKVKKNSGELEHFDRNKLARSLKLTGAETDVARRVADAIEVHEGMRTREIRRLAVEELRKVNAEVAERYERFENK
ncbi:MAG: ATP cone domain-containing protein [Candidatus Methanofastidiosia archaeon]